MTNSDKIMTGFGVLGVGLAALCGAAIGSMTGSAISGTPSTGGNLPMNLGAGIGGVAGGVLAFREIFLRK